MSVDPILQQLRSKRILIAGYGREGRSTHAFLQQYLPGQEATVAENDEAIRTLLQRDEYDWVVKSPGIPMRVFEGLCPRSVITSQTDLFLSAFASQTIGVTATKGKSTTAALLTHVLHQAGRKVVMAGNMGIPLLDILPQITDDTVVVAELSCHQLESIHRAPHIALLLNLYEEHLDHYKDYRDYQNAKLQIFLRQLPGDVAVYCADHELLNERVSELRTQIPSQLKGYHVPQHPEWQTSFPLEGSHNLGNAEAVRVALSSLDITDEQFVGALPSFHGLSHRMERVGTFRGITFYNDSISTIPAAAIAAVEALREVDTLILGGFDRGIDYSQLTRYLDAPEGLGSRVRNLVLVGQSGQRILQLLDLSSLRNILIENDYRAIVEWCYQHTAPGRICLLSPAAASYDAFKNFEHRGDYFKQLVKEKE